MYKVYSDDYLLYDPEYESLKIFSPKINLELNKTGSFDFLIYPEHPYFNKLEKLRSIIKVYQDDYLIFRGRILNDQQGFYNEKQVTCEGELAFLCDSIQRPYDFMSGDKHTTVEELFTFFIENHNSQVGAEKQFKVGRITVTDPNNYIVRSDSTYLNTWDSINKKLIEHNGGYLWIRHEPDGNYIDYLEDFNVISNQTIEFGKNLLDFDKIMKGEDIATAIIPLGAKQKTEQGGESEQAEGEETEIRLTIADLPDEETEDICKLGDYVYSKEAVEKYGWIFKTKTWDDVTIDTNLLSHAKKFLSETINQSVTIELSGFDLAALNKDISGFKLGTYIKVRSNPQNINSNFLVKKLSIELTNPGSNKLTLGITYLTFTEQTTNSNSSVDNLVQQVESIGSNVSGAIQQIQEQTSSQIIQTSTEIIQKVSEDYYLKSDAEELVESVNTQFTQTNESFEFQFNEFQKNLEDVQNGTDAQFQEISKYIRFVDGNIILGEDGNELTLKIENDRISFLDNGAEIAYWKNRKFYAVDGEFINSLKLGNFAFIPRENGNLSFKKVT